MVVVVVVVVVVAEVQIVVVVVVVVVVVGVEVVLMLVVLVLVVALDSQGGIQTLQLLYYRHTSSSQINSFQTEPITHRTCECKHQTEK